MLTQSLITVPWHAASRRGPRQINADASAVHHDPDTGRSAFVVADGIGDTWAAAAAAQLAAGIAARAAVSVGPELAILAAQRILLAEGPDDGDAVLVVAVPDRYS
jgi:protein phosphatase